MNEPFQMVPTVFDRLLDDHPQQSVDIKPGHRCSLADYHASVVRDLEILINTRRELLADQLTQWPSLEGSILEYGLPDFISRGVRSTEDRILIQHQLEQAIVRGDSRFSQVRVQLLNQDNHDRILQFRIDAVLSLREARQRVAFDAVLQVNTHRYKVKSLL